MSEKKVNTASVPSVEELSNPESLLGAKLIAAFVTEAVVDIITLMNSTLDDDKISSIVFIFEKTDRKLTFKIEGDRIRILTD